MDRFKVILRNSVSSGAFKVALVVGRAPLVTNAKGEAGIKEFGTIDLRWIQSIYNFLFQKEIDRINEGFLTKGVLNIPNLGKVLLIGQRAETTFLNLYLPPEGEFKYQQDLSEFEAMAKARDEQARPPTVPEKAKAATSIPLNMSFPPPMTDDSNHMMASPFQTQEPEESDDTEGDGRTMIYKPLHSDDDESNSMYVTVDGEYEDTEYQPDTEDGADQASPFQPTVSTIKPAFNIASPAMNQGNVQAFPAHQSAMNDDSPPVVKNHAHAPQSSNQPIAQQTQFIPASHGAKKSHAGPVRNYDESSDISPIPFANVGGASVSSGQNSIDPILKEMIKRRASDVHLVLDQPVIYRIDGSVVRMDSSPITPEQMMGFVLPMMPETNRAEFSKISDTDFAYEISEIGRFRVNIFRNSRGVGVCMRHIPATILTAEQLKVPAIIMSLCKLSKGLVLVTGPTGSGKSTTLAAMIDNINKNRSEHLLTIEDPIEFVHSQHKCLINQREVGKHTNSFARALKAALREDPDIILIGEMRDLETVHIAIETAETGHLVFGTLHTTTAVSTIDRIIDQFPADQQSQIRMMLASSLKAVVAQTLLKKKGGGRVAAHEILILNDAVGNMIREQKGHMISNHMQTQKVDGNILLNECLLNLLAAGTVEFEEAWMKSMDKKSFIEMVKRKGLPLTMSDGSTLKTAS